METSKWQTLINYLSKFDVGETIKRESLLLAIGGAARYYTTTDQYRNILCKIGYMERNTPYKIIKKIPIDLKHSDCKKEYLKLMSND